MAAKYLAVNGCEAADTDSGLRGVVGNDRLEITVRTAGGGTYVVTTDPRTNVQVGDPWPIR